MNEWCEVFLLEEMQMRFTCSLHSNMWDFPSRGKENDKPDQSCTDRDIWIWIFILVKIWKFKIRLEAACSRFQSPVGCRLATPAPFKWMWNFDQMTMKLWICESMNLWICEPVKLWSNDYKTVKLWNFETLIKWLWICETLKLWNSDQTASKTCIQVVPHFGGVTTQMSPSRTFPVKGWKELVLFILLLESLCSFKCFSPNLKHTHPCNVWACMKEKVKGPKDLQLEVKKRPERPLPLAF